MARLTVQGVWQCCSDALPWRLRKIFQFSYISFIFFPFSDGNITDSIFVVQIDEQDNGEHFKSGFHWDNMESKDGVTAPNRQPLVNEVRRGYQRIWMQRKE